VKRGEVQGVFSEGTREWKKGRGRRGRGCAPTHPRIHVGLHHHACEFVCRGETKTVLLCRGRERTLRATQAQGLEHLLTPWSVIRQFVGCGQCFDQLSGCIYISI